MSTLVPRSYFHKPFYSDAVAAVVRGVSTLLRNIVPKIFPSVVPQPRDAEVSVFDVLAIMLQDESLASAPIGTPVTEALLASVLETKGDTIRK